MKAEHASIVKEVLAAIAGAGAAVWAWMRSRRKDAAEAASIEVDNDLKLYQGLKNAVADYVLENETLRQENFKLRRYLAKLASSHPEIYDKIKEDGNIESSK